MGPKRLAFASHSKILTSRSRSAFSKSRMTKKSTEDIPVDTIDISDLQTEVKTEEMVKAAHEDVILECLVGFSENISTRQSRAIITILDDAIDELKVLIETADATKKVVDLTYKTLSQRFDTKAADETIFDLETLELYDEAYFKQAEYTKVQTECIWLMTVLEQITDQNDLGQCIFALQKILSAYSLTKSDEQTLLKDLAENDKKLKYIKDSLIVEKQEMTREIKKGNEEIANLKDEMEDLIAENRVKYAYIVQWEDTRIETNEMVQDKKEKKFSQTIKCYDSEMEKEQRIHSEILSFIADSEEHYKTEMDKWIEKYDADLDAKEIEIQKLKTRQEEQKEELEALRAEYGRRKKAIDEYLAYKELKRQEAEELQRKHRAATRIQAWWRGTMYRRGLGPWRKKKGKKGKGKGGKGNKPDGTKGKGSVKGKKK